MKKFSKIFGLVSLFAMSSGALISAKAFDTKPQVVKAVEEYEKVNVEVTGCSIMYGAWLQITLSDGDFVCAADNAIENSKVSSFNFNSSMYLNGDKSLNAINNKSLELFCFGGNSKSVGFSASGDRQGFFDDIHNVTIPAGTEFPSYEYVSDTTGTVAKKAYVVTTTVTFGKISKVSGPAGAASFTMEKYEYAETNVDKFCLAAINQIWPAFHFTNNDMSNLPASTSLYFSSLEYPLNFYNNIKFTMIDPDTDEVDVYSMLDLMTLNTVLVNFKETFPGYVGFPINSNAYPQYTDNWTSVLKVEIPAGTQFPSANWATSSNLRNKIYVTTEDCVFTQHPEGDLISSESSYIRRGAVEYIDTSISSIAGASSPFPQSGSTFTNFQFVIKDLYGERDGNSTSLLSLGVINLFDKIQFIDGDGQDITPTFSQFIRGAAFANFNTSVDFLFQMKADVSSAVTIIFKKGLTLPSNAYAKTGTGPWYRLSSDCIFLYGGAAERFTGVSNLDYLANVLLKLNTTIEEGQNLCISEGWYATVKPIYNNNLSVAEHYAFCTNARYAAAYARLCAWANANGDSIVNYVIASNNNMELVNSNSSLTIIIVSISLVMLLGIAILASKRRQLSK